jgi:hypothetical protein
MVPLRFLPIYFFYFFLFYELKDLNNLQEHQDGYVACLANLLRTITYLGEIY